MPRRPPPEISSRKQPRQARSTELVATILEAAAQVLAKEGAARFTTARVAEKAGISVGSLYQYFPNKAAILFRLQADEWRETSETLARILDDGRKPPLERLRAWVLAFIKSECDEAGMRLALNDAAPLYRDAPEAIEAKGAFHSTMTRFMQAAAPGASEAARALAGDLVLNTLGAVGHDFSARPRTGAEIRTYANAISDMFCAYIRSLDAPEEHAASPKPRRRAAPRAA